MEIDKIRLIESMTDRGWPPAVHRPMAGWTLRQSRVGPNTRPNSALPPLDSEPSHEQVLTDLREVMSFYRRHDSPYLNVQIVNGHGEPFEAELKKLHYRAHEPSEVLTGDLAAAVSATESINDDGASVELAAAEEWLSKWAAASGSNRQQISDLESALRRIQDPAAYAVLYSAGEIAGVGRAVRTGRWVGIFNMFVAPAARGRRFAALILRRLAAWGVEVGADTIYLQVDAENVAALNAYRRAGLHSAYRYHYLTGPL